MQHHDHGNKKPKIARNREHCIRLAQQMSASRHAVIEFYAPAMLTPGISMIR